jgi:hypothetical protein
MSTVRGPLARLAGRVASTVLDPTIVLSFDRSGFARHATGFDPRALEVDLTGRTCLVTGANSGIGYATSLGLAARGATVWMLCRNAERAEAAARELRRATSSRRVHVQLLDVSDLAAIRRFAAISRRRRWTCWCTTPACSPTTARKPPRATS